MFVYNTHLISAVCKPEEYPKWQRLVGVPSFMQKIHLSEKISNQNSNSYLTMKMF